MSEKKIQEDFMTIDGTDFDASSLSQKAGSQLESLQFVNEQLLQKHNELQIADTARILYIKALNKELVKAQV